MAKRPHQPKKKHTNQPRPEPVPALTSAERAVKAAAEFNKASAQLAEAERLAAWGQAPGSCASTAYYAMHHAARAAVLAAGGVGKRLDVPDSHEHVIQHYGKLIAQEAEPLATTGLYLTRARTGRTVADYDLSNVVDQAAADETTAWARIMVDAIQTRWAL